MYVRAVRALYESACQDLLATEKDLSAMYSHYSYAQWGMLSAEHNSKLKSLCHNIMRLRLTLVEKEMFVQMGNLGKDVPCGQDLEVLSGYYDSPVALTLTDAYKVNRIVTKYLDLCREKY